MTGAPAERPLGRTLITGAAGFLGAALMRRLAGEDVVGTDIAGATVCDVTDFAQVERVASEGDFATILHCGAVSGPMVMADRPKAIWRINATGTMHVLEAARRHGRARVVICSTCEVYGDAAGTVDETALPRPVNVYAASKVAAEQAAMGYAAEHGVDAVALRLAWIYGPGRRTPTLLEDMLRAAAEDRAKEFDGHPEDPTHYLHIDDAVEGVLRAAHAAALPSPVYNIAAGAALPLGEVFARIRWLRPKARITLAPRRPPERHPAELDNRRAAAELGFRPTVELTEGLKRSLAALAA